VWPQKVGLYGQWVHSWPAELYPEEMYKAVLLLEDDLEVSPHYAKWFIGAHQAYGGLPGVGAITGQRPNLVAAGPLSLHRADSHRTQSATPVHSETRIAGIQVDG
jgi:hypothetical protein